MFDDREFPDDELLSLLKEDSEQALVHLYYRYWNKLLMISVNLIGNQQAAEECVQNVFISLWKRRNSLSLTHSLKTYLSVCIKYQSLTFLSYNHKRNEVLEIEREDIISFGLDPEQEYLSKELYLLIEASINKLPEQCQIVFRKRKDENLSIKEIANELNISPNTVKMHLKIASKRLKNDLLVFLLFYMIHFYK